MKDILVSYSTAKLAYEKGFDESTPDDYIIFGKADRSLMEEPVLLGCEDDFDELINEKKLYPYHDVNCPTQSLLQAWLRDAHGIDLWFGMLDEPNKYHVEDIIQDNLIIGGVNEGSKTYEEALELGLIEALNLLKYCREKNSRFKFRKYRESGMKDDNGIEIIEGDIINADGYDSNIEDKYGHAVEYNMGQFGSDIYSDFEPLSKYYNIEVIGHVEDFREEIERGDWSGNLSGVLK